MSNELTEADRAAVNAAHWYCRHDGPITDTDSLCQDCENIARAIVAAVAPIVEAEALREARALHGKPEFMDSFGVRVCPECSLPSYYEVWPCRTAIALGLAEGDDNP